MLGIAPSGGALLWEAGSRAAGPHLDDVGVPAAAQDGHLSLELLVPSVVLPQQHLGRGGTGVRKGARARE